MSQQTLPGKHTVSQRVGLVPRMALDPDEAAHAIGVSRRFFYDRVLPELRVVRRGRKRIIPTKELDRWLSENADRVFD